MLWLQFLICASLIIISGYKLTIFAGTISDRTRFSATLMGTLVLAAITSCPELVTTLSSVTVVNAPDLAIGDLLGADSFNILTLAALAILFGKGSLLRGQNKVNIFIGLLSILMALVIIGFIALARLTSLSLQIYNISLGSILLGLMYVGGIFVFYKKDVPTAKPDTTERVTPDLILKFFACTAVIIASGIWLASIGKNISVAYRLNEMYVGVLLVAIVTTMPEFVVSFTALKQNSVSMATGNLLGSNIFNLSIIFLLDVAYRRGNFFSYISELNIYPALFAIILTTIAVVAMSKKTQGRRLSRFSWDSIIIVVAFLIGHYLLFRLAATVN